MRSGVNIGSSGLWQQVRSVLPRSLSLNACVCVPPVPLLPGCSLSHQGACSCTEPVCSSAFSPSPRSALPPVGCLSNKLRSCRKSLTQLLQHQSAHPPSAPQRGRGNLGSPQGLQGALLPALPVGHVLGHVITMADCNPRAAPAPSVLA